jgi:xylulokinase
MYLGLDLGTSGVKAVIMDDAGHIVATGHAALTVSRPHPLHSEQDPADWWRATCAAVSDLPHALRAQVKAIGLSGQMHGAVLLDEDQRVLRPAILWNDGRSGQQCGALEAQVPDLAKITGNRAMPGFTAPKLLWVREYEPDVFAATATVLLPKDWLRLQMSGQAVSEMSDAAGTLWLDVGKREWSDVMLAVTGLTRDHMPRLVEGCDVSCQLSDEVATDWGVPAGVPIAGGGGDNAASAVGIGVVEAGQGFISLGTSGVIFVAADSYQPNSDQGVHCFCHAVPNQWHWMSVILSASSAIDWAIAAAGFADIADALTALEHEATGDIPIFLPYLSGERTPHNDPLIKGAFVGLTHATTRTDMVRAALDGVAFAFGDGFDALRNLGAMPETLMCVGGGARLAPLLPILASVLGTKLALVEGAESAAALGAARLARLALTGEAPPLVCTSPVVRHVIAPDPALAQKLAPRRALYQKLYPALKDLHS